MAFSWSIDGDHETGNTRKRPEGARPIWLLALGLPLRRSSEPPFRDTLYILASSELVSPPTKLQTFFFRIVITRIWVDPKHDIDLVRRDFHSLDQRPDEVALARPVRRLQPVVEFGSKVLQAANNQLQLPVQGGFLRQRLALLLQPGQALAQAGNPRLKLGLVNEALRITVDQPGHTLAHLADLVFDGGQRRVCGAGLGLQ